MGMRLHGVFFRMEDFSRMEGFSDSTPTQRSHTAPLPQGRLLQRGISSHNSIVVNISIKKRYGMSEENRFSCLLQQLDLYAWLIIDLPLA